MSTGAIEKRVEALEQELARIKGKVERMESTKPWWEQIAGTFQDDPIYADAMELGRRYRQSLGPNTAAQKKRRKRP